MCVVLLYLILRILRENSAVISKNTYKLHLQFTLLLTAQVSLFKKLGQINIKLVFCHYTKLASGLN